MAGSWGSRGSETGPGWSCVATLPGEQPLGSGGGGGGKLQAGEPPAPAREPGGVYIILYIYNSVFVVAMGMSTIAKPED